MEKLMSTIDQQFVEYVVKTLVNNPDKVKVDRTVDEKGVLLSLEVDPEDVGRIIGRKGATAQSIRTLLRALGTKNDARYNLKIVNNDDYVPRERSFDAGTTGADDSFATPEATAGAETSEGGEGDMNEGASAEAALEASGEPTEAVASDATEAEGGETSALAEKTRAELADLDDLDI